MKVWLITVGEPLPINGDAERLWRTGLLASELRRRGHHITWWTSTVDHFNKKFHIEESRLLGCGERLDIQFLHGRMYRRNISFQRLFNHREIAREFRRLAAQHQRPDVILCSFPTIELSYEAVESGRKMGVPVLLDVRDLWPDEIAIRVPGPLRWLMPVVFRGLYRQTSLAFQRASGIVGISSSYLDWGLSHARRKRGPLDIVATHGYPDPFGSSSGASQRTSQLYPDAGSRRKRFWFAGTFVGSIDLGTVIEAARLLSHRKDIEFVLTGSGERTAEWQKQAQGLANVTFTGWAQRDQLARLATEAYAGLAPYRRGALMSLTNKIFEYLGFGLPVLCSLPGEARALLESSGAGIYYAPESSEGLASAINSLADAQAYRNQMASAARKLFEQEFSAERVYVRLADYLEACAGNDGSDPS